MAAEEPRWPAELGSIADVLDFLTKTGTPNLASSEFELDYYPPEKSAFVEKSVYCDADGAPYRFFVFGKATSGLVYGDTGPYFTIESGEAPDERAGPNFCGQLKALALPVRRDEDEDYDENKNKNMLVTPCTNSNAYDMTGGTYINLRVGYHCVLWNEDSDAGKLQPTIPAPDADYSVSAGSWVLGFGTLHKRESVHWETRRYELMVWDLRILNIDESPRKLCPSVAAADTEDVRSTASFSVDTVSTAPAESPSGLVDGEEGNIGIANTAVGSSSTHRTDAEEEPAPVSIHGEESNSSVEGADLATTSDSTLSDVSASDSLQAGRGGGKRSAPHHPTGPPRKSKRSRTQATQDGPGL